MSNRLRLAAALSPALVAPDAPLGARRVRPVDDLQALAVLMLEAYRGTVDDEGGTMDDALDEVACLLAGDYGDFDLDASEVVERDGALAAATLITRWEDEPFVAFSMTAAAAKRRGLARTGLQRAMATLAARGETRLGLMVTTANEPAVALYRSLGFAEAR